MRKITASFRKEPERGGQCAWSCGRKRLGTIKNLDALAEKVRKALENPALVKNLVCKEFNIRETSTESWLTFEQIDNQERYDIKKLKPRYGIGGCDLSSTTDLTCATIIFMVPGDEHIYVKQMYWLPEDLLEKRVREDKIHYDIWRQKGYLRTCPGNRMHYKYVVDWYREVQEQDDIYLYKCGVDGWSASYFIEEMKNTFGSAVIDLVFQGKKTLQCPADEGDHQQDLLFL